MTTYKKLLGLFVLTFFLLVLSGNLMAQAQQFVQSHFVGASIRACDENVDCDRNEGVLRFRFEGGELSTNTDGDPVVQFEVQMRASIPRDPDDPISSDPIEYHSGSVIIDYSANGFAENNITNDCSASGGLFDDSGYTGTVDTVEINRKDTLSLSISNEGGRAVISSISDWVSFAEVECKIDETDSDAGLAFQATTYQANKIWDPDASSASTVVFALAENDLRGLRLDGKTYAEDYWLSDDNSQVLVKFSKGIGTTLTSAHFNSNSTNVTGVDHNPGDDSALINYVSSNANLGVLSLVVSTSTYVILDVDNKPLAGGSFVAELNYSENASVISDIDVSVYEVTTATTFFDISITHDDVIGDNFNQEDILCLVSESSGLCPEQQADQMFSIERFDVHRTFIAFRVEVPEVPQQETEIFLRLKPYSLFGSEDLEPIEVLQPSSRIVLPDLVAPRVMVNATPNRLSPSNPGGNNVYDLRFEVSYDDEGLVGTTSTESYLLRRISHGATGVDVFEFDEILQTVLVEEDVDSDDYDPNNFLRPTRITAGNAPGFVVVEYDNVAVARGAATVGFALAYGGNNLIRDAGDFELINAEGEILGTEDRFDLRPQAESRILKLECSAIYPNIGQESLFLLTNLEIINKAGLTVDGEMIDADAVSQLEAGLLSFVDGEPRTAENADNNGDLVLKIDLDEEITVAPLLVGYAPTTGTAPTMTVECETDLVLDSDLDGARDVVDIQPFYRYETVNTDLAQAEPLPAIPTTSTFYNVFHLIPSLLSGEKFTYVEVEGAKPVKKEFTEEMAMTINEYFGIADPDARLFIGSDEVGGNFRCARLDTILDANISGVADTEGIYLTRIEIGEYCTELTDISDLSFGTRYNFYWAKVTEEGFIASNVIVHPSVEMIPERNFVGQSSYLHAIPTTRTVIILENNSSGHTSLEVKRLSERGGTPQTTVLESDIISGWTHDRITTHETTPSEVVTYWLTGDLSNNIWYPSSTTVVPIQGGHNFASTILAAIGSNNNIDVKVAGDDEPVTQMHRIWLYSYHADSDQAQKQAYVRAGQTYYVVADFTTNIQDIENQTMPNIMLADSYEIQATTPSPVALQMIIRGRFPRAGNELIGNGYDVIVLTVDEDIDSADTITVGWKQLGNLENIEATFSLFGADYAYYDPSDTDRVSPLGSLYDIGTGATFGAFDADKDRIPLRRDADDIGDDGNRFLSVYYNDENDPNHILRTITSQPLYVSDPGMIIALQPGEEIPAAGTFSPANIKYSNLSDNAKAALGFSEVGFDSEITVPIETIATYGVREVDYSIADDGKSAEPTFAYTVFPVQSEVPGEILYLSRYNNHIGRWDEFRRGTLWGDTWYAIAREQGGSNPIACPTHIETYKKGHKAVGEQGLGFTALANNCIMVVTPDGSPYDRGSVDGRVSQLLSVGMQRFSIPETLECSAFYPNIGQTKLSFKVSSSHPVDSSRLALMRGGNRVRIDQVLIKETDDKAISILNVTLRNPITRRAAISATYTANDSVPNGEESTAVCSADLDLTVNSDGDNLPDGSPLLDIADNAPFDANDNTLSPNFAAVGRQVGEAMLPSSQPFYNRNTVIRSLLRGEEFTYKQRVGDDLQSVLYTVDKTITPRQYFGVEANAELYRITDNPADTTCRRVLATAKSNNIRVRIGDFCTDRVQGNNIADEPHGTYNYAWINIASNGMLRSGTILNDVNILPEINLSAGQTSYLYAEPSTETVTITSEVGSAHNIEIMRNITPSSIRLGNDGTAEYQATSGAAGETITYWLSSPEIWNHDSNSLDIIEGGRVFSGTIMYAAGPNNYVDLRLASAEEAVTYIHRVELYDVGDTEAIQRVTAVMPEGSYYLLADLTTTADLTLSEEIVEFDGQDGGYTQGDVDEDIKSEVCNQSHFDGKDCVVIAFSVNTNSGTITVGWDMIGNAENIMATYRVSDSLPSDSMDSDGDRIPDAFDQSSGNELQVAINGAVEARNALRTSDNAQTLFVSDAGLIIAGTGDDAAAYSAANIRYSGLDDDMKELLGSGFATNNPIETITTFEVRGIKQAFEEEEAKGGVAYVSFPIESSADQTLYLGKYDEAMENWKQFRRMTGEYEDTWYAIARGGRTQECPVDLETYKNGHIAAPGQENLGFTARAQTQYCIMLVLTDGGPYDNSGIDGRVIDPLSMSSKRFESCDEIPAPEGCDNAPPPLPPSSGGGSGGGGTIGIGDVLLLLGALAMLLIFAGRQYRREPRV